ncbi:MAG: hypothetical protein KKF65_04035 [Nanoarchaeota archaeon]|nr:hypothetical protein [Nanoarchaeota archaeon]
MFIVGGIILLFFVFVIRSQTDEADIELASSIIKNLDTVIKSSQQKEGNLNIIKIPDVKIQFVCEEDISFYDLGNGITKDIPYDIIFSQGELSGNQIISWTQSWDVPFRISFFQYLTTRNAQFIIVDDENKATELLNMLPNNITKKIINTNEPIKDYNYDYYKIIQFKGSEHNGEKPTENVHIITIDSEDINSFGKITFDNEGESSFLKKESLLGAIFSEDKAYYECTMKKAFERLETLMELNKERIKKLSANIADQKCFAIYGFCIEEIDDILLTPKLSNSQTIYYQSKELARDNQNLIRGKNCPLIY